MLDLSKLKSGKVIYIKILYQISREFYQVVL
jgi:hypothetical protein